MTDSSILPKRTTPKRVKIKFGVAIYDAEVIAKIAPFVLSIKYRKGNKNYHTLIDTRNVVRWY